MVVIVKRKHLSCSSSRERAYSTVRFTVSMRHQRLPAEEVHLNVPPLAGLLHHPVDGPLGGIKVHGHAVAGAEVASRGKAVAAAQVAVVGDMQAQGLHHRRLGQGHGGSRVDVVVI